MDAPESLQNILEHPVQRHPIDELQLAAGDITSLLRRTRDLGTDRGR